ncbi:MAG TPA: hypothetical protein PKH72_12265 [Rhodoferax sp.]|jgi:hypothetical protein|nr:hypothetical protein [Rhodoferax sp.]HNV60421.1 hypothetical protein [Rhodoferax sp.]HPW27837.1 hypothetical protein [Rhodoferax sp.]
MQIATFSPAVLIQENTKQIAALSDEANERQIAEHIRGMVAATMGNLSILASDANRNDAEQWQEWALGIADGLELPVSG